MEILTSRETHFLVVLWTGGLGVWVPCFWVCLYNNYHTYASFEPSTLGVGALFFNGFLTQVIQNPCNGLTGTNSNDKDVPISKQDKVAVRVHVSSISFGDTIT